MALRIPFGASFWQDYLSGQEANLPSLPDVKQLSDRVVRILGGNPGSMQLQGTNTYLVGTGCSRILIDTGQGDPHWIQTIIQELENRKLEISHVLLTHWHGDHTGGVDDLMAYDPRVSSRVYKNQPDLEQNPIQDAQKFRAEGATLRAVFTPGHASDHMCFVLEEENALFTGDNVLGHGYSVVEDLGAYMVSLARMADLQCTIGYPAHGARIDKMQAKMNDYIYHKTSRLRQVLSTLERSLALASDPGRRGGLTFPEIVRSMYGRVPEEVEKAMEPFLNQVLWKLAEDRKVGFGGEPTQRRWFALALPVA